MNQKLGKDGGNGALWTDASVTPAPVNNLLGRTGRDRDFLYVAEGARSFSGEREGLKWDARHRCLVATQPSQGAGAIYARYISTVIPCKFPALQFLPSWNIKSPPGTGFRVLIRVFDAADDVSPWFLIGEGGEWRKHDDEITSDAAWGKVRIDYLDLVRPARAFQYKVEFIAFGQGGVTSDSAEFHRYFMHYSGEGLRGNRQIGSRQLESVQVNVPYRSQLDVEREELRHVVCCPTCVAMVLESYGINRPTLEVCDLAYDERYEIYGIWPRASQAAFLCGAKAWVQRFRHFTGVRACLQSGQPIIASIRVNEGELRGARYPRSSGHLIVIKGISPNGKILCNDPYSAGPDGHEIEYEKEDIEKVWLDCGGVAIMVGKQ